MPHRFPVRVYYEDTDLAGIVYYANYLKFIERGRTEWVRSLGVDQTRLRDEEGLVFAVRRIEADYLRSARFDDELVVETEFLAIVGTRIRLRQTVFRGEERLFDSEVTLVAITREGRAARVPTVLSKRLVPDGHSSAT